MKLGVTIGFIDLKGSILRQAGLIVGKVGQYPLEIRQVGLEAA